MTNITDLATKMLHVKLYPRSPEACGVALALLVIDALHKAKGLKCGWIPETDQKFRRKIRNAKYRIKQRIEIEDLVPD